MCDGAYKLAQGSELAVLSNGDAWFVPVKRDKTSETQVACSESKAPQAAARLIAELNEHPSRRAGS